MSKQTESERRAWTIDDSDPLDSAPLELGFTQAEPQPSPATPAGPSTRSSHGIYQPTRTYVPGVSTNMFPNPNLIYLTNIPFT